MFSNDDPEWWADLLGLFASLGAPSSSAVIIVGSEPETVMRSLKRS